MMMITILIVMMILMIWIYDLESLFF
jgi:hypothetical protein